MPLNSNSRPANSIPFNSIHIQFNSIPSQFNSIQIPIQFNSNSNSIQFKFNSNSIRLRGPAGPGTPQTFRGAKEGETVSSIACLGRRRPAGDSISVAEGVLGRRQACGAWWCAWKHGVFHPQGGFSGNFFLFFLPVRIVCILGSRPPEIELRTEARSPSSVNCNECIPKKNRHSESVPRIHSLS